MIFKAGLIEDRSVAKMLAHPEEYIESKEYFSWERFFAAQLIQSTKNSYLKYAKRQLNPVYLQEKVSDRILAVMKGIELN